MGKTTLTEKFTKNVRDGIEQLNKELTKRKKEKIEIQKSEYIEKEFLTELRQKRDYVHRENKSIIDAALGKYNSSFTSLIDSLLKEFELCKDKYLPEVFIDIMVESHLMKLIDRIKLEFKTNNELDELDRDFVTNLSIESTLQFFIDYYIINDFLNIYYQKSDEEIQLKTILKKSKEPKDKYSLTNLNLKEHILIWSAFIENKIFINNSRLSPITKMGKAFERLTGYSGHSFARQRKEKINNCTDENYDKVIIRLKEVVKYLEENK